MNFDQKAVKFLANFYINGDKHWTHGPLKLKSSKDGGLRGVGTGAGAAWEMWPPAVVLESPAGLRMHRGPLQEPQQNCTLKLKELWLEQRPPIVTDPDVPGPTKYSAPDASVRESSPHPHFSIGRKHPTPEGGGRRAWQTVWFQSESPFTQKADFCWEQKWPSPADYHPLSGPASPAFSFGGPRPASKTRDTRARPALPRASDAAHTPGPATYYVEDCYNSRFPSAPGVVIQGVRRPKRHDTGPFCAL